MGRYKKDEVETRGSSESYLSHLDEKFGMVEGTFYSMCEESMSGESVERKECRITYKGPTTKLIRVGAGRFVPIQKKVFLIEGSEQKGERKVLAQVFLSMPKMSQTRDSIPA